MNSPSNKPKTAEKPKAKPEAKTEGKKGMIAVILVRGTIGASQKVVDTLGMMRLKRKNVCIVIENTRSNMGMIQKVKDYITWGEVDETTVKSLIEKRSEKNPDNPSRTKPYFRLNAPRKGFGRKGIKVFFNKRGALGYRGEKINDLIMRML